MKFSALTRLLLLSTSLAFSPALASQQLISTGTKANAGDGDTLRSAFIKTNSNFTDLYSQVNANTANVLLNTNSISLLAQKGANSDITSLTAYSLNPANSIPEGSFILNGKYKITVLGNTNWNALGYVGTPVVGGWFVANSAGSSAGTGKATSGTLTFGGQLLLSNIYNDANAPQGFRSNYTQRANFAGAATFHTLSCIYGGTGYQAAYGTGTACANIAFAPTGIVPDGQGLFIINETYKIVALGNTNWASLGYVGTPVVGGTFVATATQSSVAGGTGTASAPFWTYHGKEFFSFSATVVIASGNPGATDSDLVGNTGAIGINDTTEGVLSAGHFVVNDHYMITDLGSPATDFVAIGASANQLGVVFQATGRGDPATTGKAKATGSHLYPGFFTLNASDGAEFPIGNGVKVEEALSCFNGRCAQVRYMTGASVQMNGAVDVSGHLINAGAYTVNTVYKIVSTSTGAGAVTDFTLIGAPDNNQGTRFIATGPGTGTGTATEDATSAGFVVSGTNINQNFHYALLLGQEIPHLGNLLPQPLATDASIIGYDNPTPCSSAGPLIDGTITNPGSGYTSPTAPATFYTLVPLVYAGTPGGGVNAFAQVTIAGGVVTQVVVLGASRGTGFIPGEVLTAAASNIGGTVTTPFTWTVGHTAGVCPMTVANWISLHNVTVTGYLFDSPHYSMTGDGVGMMSSLTINGYNQGTTGTILAAGTQTASMGLDFHNTLIADKYIWFPNFLATPQGTSIPSLVLTGHSPINPLPNNMRVSGVVVANTGNTLCGPNAQWCWEILIGVGLLDGTNPTVATVSYAPIYHQ